MSVAKLARKRPSPLLSGRHGTWAAAVVYALGQVNFLFDASSEPHLTADELSAAFGIAKSTMSSKAKQVRDLVKMSHFTTEFMRHAHVIGWCRQPSGRRQRHGLDSCGASGPDRGSRRIRIHGMIFRLPPELRVLFGR